MLASAVDESSEPVTRMRTVDGRSSRTRAASSTPFITGMLKSETSTATSCSSTHSRASAGSVVAIGSRCWRRSDLAIFARDERIVVDAHDQRRTAHDATSASRASCAATAAIEPQRSAGDFARQRATTAARRGDT